MHVKRDGVAKEARYGIGTSVFVRTSMGKPFILTALSETDPNTHRTKASLQMLVLAIRGALSVARECANGEPVSFCVIGAGNARIKASDQMLFTTLLATIISECLENGKVSNRINIILNEYPSFAAMNLYDLSKEWSV